jgi:hypothetical protein
MARIMLRLEARKETIMGTHNKGSFAETRHLFDGRFDRFKTSMHAVLNRVMKEPDGSPSRLATWSARATDAVKAHPYIAVGAAVALGYAIVRIVRR